MSDELKFKIKVSYLNSGEMIIDSYVTREGLDTTLEKLAAFEDDEREEFIDEVIDNPEEEFHIFDDRYEIFASVADSGSRYDLKSWLDIERRISQY